MIKKKIWKSATLVGLSAVLLGGAATAFSGCKGSDLSLSVSIFGNEQDAATNRVLCEKWAKEYSKKLVAEGVFDEGEEIRIEFDSQSNTETYFSNLSNLIGSNNAPDVFYVSPKYVKVWTKLGRILDLTEYFDKTEEAALSDIWEDSLGFYGYSDDKSYTQGERISYDREAGVFKTASGITAGLYGLPKDYSNFGLGFNNKFFTDNMRAEYASRRATEPRTVKGAEYDTKNISARGGEKESGVITYAVDGNGFSAGDDAPIINVGIPTTYKPYNFYRFANYREALEKGDPMANAVEDITGGEGYTVTIPGYPGDTFEMPSDMRAENATYDASKGYITYTFSEYGALTWALTYYLNTFAWDNGQTDPLGGVAGGGNGGTVNATGEWKNVYGNDQYDGVLYLLPWLAGNDANYIDTTSTKVVNGTDAKAVGTQTETVKKLDIYGNLADKQIQYGVNSANYIETYGAFLAYGSDWNGNSNNAGDTQNSKLSGWDLFCAGACVFYGAGTWDASTRNQSQYQYLQFRQMPEPVGDKYSLYSLVKDANYSTELKEYSWDGGNGWAGGKKIYTQEEIVANQAERQDKWGARMDSVGYGVNAETKKLEGKAAWKAAGAAALVRELTINQDVQKTLTYSGAQLPNFKSQCVEFLRYQEAGYENGSFRDMITPDGSATVTGEAGKALWNEYLEIVEKLYAAKQAGVRDTVQAWMDANYPGKTFDPAFAADSVSTVENRAYAMKVLCMTTYTREDRDLSLRMQSGLNSVRDSSMYTYESGWLSKLEGRGNNFLMAYTMQKPIIDSNGKPVYDLVDGIVRDVNIVETTNRFATPQWFCLSRAQSAQTELDLAISHEKMALGE